MRKRGDFNLNVVKYPYLKASNIAEKLVYIVYTFHVLSLL